MAAVAALLLLAGCGNAGSAAEAAARSSAVKVPAAGVAQAASTRGLQAYGFSHAPGGFVLPQGLDILYKIDQPNVVTAFFPAADGAHLATWLAANLPAMGYQVQGRRPTRWCSRAGRGRGPSPAIRESPHSPCVTGEQGPPSHSLAGDLHSSCHAIPKSMSIWRTSGRLMPTTLCGSPSTRVTKAPPSPSIVNAPATRCGSPLAT